MLATISTLLASGLAQTPPKGSTLTIAGHPRKAPLLQINGKSYIDIETLARLTQGTLSFKSNQTILALPSDRDTPAPAPHASVGFSRAFTQASVEELGVIREWRIAIVNAVGSNSPASEERISTQHRLAEKNLALASVGCFVFTSGLRSFAIGEEGLETGASIRAAGPVRKTLAGIPFKSVA